MQERIPLTPSEHLASASDAMTSIGISHEPGSLQYNVTDGSVSGLDVNNGSLNVRVKGHRELDNPERYVYLEPINVVDSANGQLVNTRGRIEGTVQRPGAEPLGYDVAIEAFSTPKQLNDVEHALGRVDAFRYAMAPGEDEMSLGIWVPPFADATVLSADPGRRGDWDVAAHDLELGGHTRAWRHSNGEFCRRMAGEARRLMEIHGDTLFLPKGERPPEIDRYADALELLPIFIDPVIQRVREMTQAAEREDSGRLASSLDALGDLLTPKVLHEIWWGDRDKIPELHGRMQALGLVPGETDLAQMKSNIVTLAANRLGESTKTLLKVDELWPRKDLTPGQQMARTVALEHVGNVAVVAQERGVGQSLALSPQRSANVAERLLELADSKVVLPHDTYMTLPHARTQDETGRDRNLPEQALGQTPIVELEPLGMGVPPRPTLSPLEVLQDQATSQGKDAADEAARQQQVLLQQQELALSLELDQNFRDRD